ncbi:MAG TPA: ATP-binding protein [Vulgatibacter sp.]|nr:ATP-binding protein [Vulgatibacter sp.]
MQSSPPPRPGRPLDLAAILEILEAATSHLDVEELLRVVVAKIAAVIPVDRCSAILADGAGARVVASHDVPDLDPLDLDLRKYPELVHAFTSKEPLVIDDVRTDPLMEPVRPLVAEIPVSSLVVAPLVASGDSYGALYLRLARDRAFGPDEQAFVRAAASALANSIRNARLHTSVRRRRDELEAAYLERYRELDRANELLRETSRLKDELLSIVSHDVRAPLNVLLGHARLLLAGDLAPPQRRSVEAVERQGLRILELVQTILDRGRGRTQEWELTFGLADLAELARSVAADLSTLGSSKEVRLEVTAPASFQAQVDESAIRQVLENLVANAVTHSPEGASVEIALSLDESTGGRARFEVRDRGPGIPESEQALLFERQRKGAESAGFGLGLAIARELVELHGGDVWIRSGPEEGTSFYFSIPTSPPSARAARKLLFVSEDPVRRAAIRDALVPAYDVSLARTAQEGIARARALLPDAVLLDRALVDSTSNVLRGMPGLADTPILPVDGDVSDLRGRLDSLLGAPLAARA